MAKSIHILIEKDLENRTGVCKECGPVDLLRMNRGGRCGNAVRSQRGTDHEFSYRSDDAGTVYLSREARTEILEPFGNECNICHRPFDENNVPNLDHCHSTGHWRGALCRDCNTGLGAFKDNITLLMEAIKYLGE